VSLWIQHGYAKANKLETLLESGSLGGVILSPADETRTTMLDTVRRYRAEDVELLLDPQTYVWSIPDGVAPRHASHGLEIPNLHWSLGANEVENTVRKVLEADEALGLEAVIAPSCIQRSFSDPWTTLAVQFARETLAGSPNRPVYITVAIDESALSSWAEVADWLDVITTLDAAGFYIVVARGREGYLRPWEPTRLANLLRLVYRLGPINEYKVLVGYSDLDGLATLAAGASGIGSGWYQSLRSFSEAKWQPSTGGGRAKPRVTSEVLLTPLVVDGEASAIARSRLGEDAFPDAGLRSAIGSHPEAWSLLEAWMQHLGTVRSLAREVEESTDVRERCINYASRLEDAGLLLDQLSESGYVLNTSYRSRIRMQAAGVREFQTAEGLD
jgi:hypothetical protein